MCDHCGCQAIATIATLTREHDDVLDLLRTAAQALRSQDTAQLQVSCRALTALLGPHTAVEEQALFPALEGDFPLQIARLVDEHRAFEQAIVEAGSTGARLPGWEARFERAVNDLHLHIRKEEDGVFPAALSTLTPAQWDRLDQVRAACVQSGQSGPLPPHR
jgi:hemerythrin-like domain-containing protein